MKIFISSPAQSIQGAIKVPGDKSISHRSIMLGSLANGTTIVSGFLNGEDCLATMKAFQAMGVDIEFDTAGCLTIHGVGLHGLKQPKHPIYLGNSGTSIRLLSGILAGQKFSTTLTGDASLSKRPMQRVMKPLQEMGAKITLTEQGTPPLTIKNSAELNPITYALPMASAQVKSCVLLAGLYVSGKTTVIEPAPTRDHTERMLRAFGVRVNTQANEISMEGRQELTATKIDVPGDISSAAFFMVAASITPNSELTLENIGINPTRTGCIDILKLMGANIELLNQRVVCGEPVADINIRSAELKGIEIPHQLIPIAIDEFPVLFIAAAAAKGKTVLTGAKELRVKESDRIHAMAVGLLACGIECKELEDGIIIHGGELSAGTVDAKGDHRIAMAFSVAGLIARESIIIRDCANVSTSFPNFVKLGQSVGFNLEIEL